jgi:hypothetical protein
VVPLKTRKWTTWFQFVYVVMHALLEAEMRLTWITCVQTP